MSDKPIPCSCCGEMPEEHKRDLHPGPVGSNIHRSYCCTTLTCPVFLMTRDTLLSLGRWNEVHDRMLELQRQAFEAGYALAVHQEMGSGKMDWSKSRSSPQLFGENYGDEEYDGVDAFDFYLAERSAK